MSDEIKETLDDLRKYANEGGEHKLMEYEIKHIQCYITNLQEEVKSANESITWWTNRFNALQKENRRLKETKDKIITKLKEEVSYLMPYEIYHNEVDSIVKKVEKIANGEDKDVKAKR